MACSYKIIYVARGQTTQNFHDGAPPENYLCSSGARRKAAAVIRFFPSRKGWVVLDIREAVTVGINVPGRGPLITYKGQRRSKPFPNEDAAVMYAMALLT